MAESMPAKPYIKIKAALATLYGSDGKKWGIIGTHLKI
jgi:hypothetical protein